MKRQLFAVLARDRRTDADNAAQVFEDVLRELKLEWAQRRRKQLIEQVQQAETAGDWEQADRLYEQLEPLNQLYKEMGGSRKTAP